MTPELDWQLRLDGKPIAGGTFLLVLTCRITDDQVFIDLKHEQAVSATTFGVHSNISIGGKNHLILFPVGVSSPIPVVVRLFDRNRICAMDSDRFSSLRNALMSFVEAGGSTPATELYHLLYSQPQAPICDAS